MVQFQTLKWELADSGEWVLGFSQYIGEGHALKAELWAIMLGLEILSQLPYLPHIIIENDSSLAIELLLNSPPDDHHPLETLINNCRFLLTKLESYRFLKGSRKQNT